MVDRTAGFARFSDMLKHSLGSLVDQTAEDFVAMMAPDGVMEFPYAPADSVREIKGRVALSSYLSRLGDILAVDRLSEPQIHHTLTPNVVILEFECAGRALKTQRPYYQRYISVITVRDGMIERYVDYWNPLVALDALGNLAPLQGEVENKL
ncbi:nuclear transport factor 2 family protein [Hahella sp. CR1]|uniref:nuclear transport factor 2 family protein n=1 Tax=Hahella sp. CR1 TaxID=2992807 RepID=UPI00244368C7|nr:nuclear transport factor 2 family protein [Hahella sp. CR1]MDG9669505.1 nuclear transport factor 2 family protein [Hahella sp. CR1]